MLVKSGNDQSAAVLGNFCPLYGALDLGTNTCRLAIAKEGVNNGDLQLVNSFSRVIRFGEHVNETHTLSNEAMDRALSALEECARRLRLYHVNRVRCVATDACRKANNAGDFLNKVHEQTGLNLEIISPKEESALAVLGCSELMDHGLPYGLVLDIGGGSTEVVLFQLFGDNIFEIIDFISLPYGVLALRDSFRENEYYEKVTNLIKEQMNVFALKNDLYNLIDKGLIQMIGASGTVTTLAAIILNLSYYSRSFVHRTRLCFRDIECVIRMLKQMNRDQLLSHPCIGPRRTEFILGGVAIFEGIYKVLTVNPVIVADLGVREGLLRELMLKDTPTTGTQKFSDLYSAA